MSINFYQVLKRKSLWWCVKYINGETEAQGSSEASSTSYSCFFTTARTQYSLFPKLSHVSSVSLSALPFLLLPHKLEMSMCLGPQHLTLWVFILSWRPSGWCPVRSQRKEYIGHFPTPLETQKLRCKDAGVNNAAERCWCRARRTCGQKTDSCKGLEFPLGPYSLWLCEYYFLINTKVIVWGKTTGPILSFCRCCALGDPREALRCTGQSPMSSQSCFLYLESGTNDSIWFLS